MDLLTIWPRWLVIELAPEIRASILHCPYCGHRFVLDQELNLETIAGFICLGCATAYVPELAQWVRQYYELRDKRDAMRAFRDEPDDHRGLKCC